MRRLPNVGNQHGAEFTHASWMALLAGAQKAALTPWQVNKGTSLAASRTEISTAGRRGSAARCRWRCSPRRRARNSITVGSQADACLMASGKSLSMSGNAIESSKMPPMIVGMSPCGKYPFGGWAAVPGMIGARHNAPFGTQQRKDAGSCSLQAASRLDGVS